MRKPKERRRESDAERARASASQVRRGARTGQRRASPPRSAHGAREPTTPPAFLRRPPDCAQQGATATSVPSVHSPFPPQLAPRLTPLLSLCITLLPHFSCTRARLAFSLSAFPHKKRRGATFRAPPRRAGDALLLFSCFFFSPPVLLFRPPPLSPTSAPAFFSSATVLAPRLFCFPHALSLPSAARRCKKMSFRRRSLEKNLWSVG